MKIGNPEEKVRLKELAEKIKALLVEYDVAAVVNIQSKDQVEYINHVNPTWSCLFLETDDDGDLRIRFKAKSTDEASWEKARLTVGMVCGFEHVLGHQSEQMRSLLLLIGKHIGIENVIRQEED